MDYDELLDVLLCDDTMIVEEPIVVVPQKQNYKFNCVEDNETYYPDVVSRRRYGGYKPPKAPKVIFLNPFEKKKPIDPPYMKELQNSMERMRIRENDMKDRKIKYIKKKYPNQ
jgi:hypothetical protein